MNLMMQLKTLLSVPLEVNDNSNKRSGKIDSKSYDKITKLEDNSSHVRIRLETAHCVLGLDWISLIPKSWEFQKRINSSVFAVEQQMAPGVFLQIDSSLFPTWFGLDKIRWNCCNINDYVEKGWILGLVFLKWVI